MEQIIIEDHGDVALLRLANGVTNAIGPALVEELGEALETIKTTYRGMVLAGGAKFFSMGFDLPLLLTLDKDEMAAFFNRFNAVMLALYALPLPTACAIEGHAVAGGTILALTCDMRYGVAEKKLMGLNEVQLGVPVPYLADMMVRQIVGDRQATRMLFGGDLISLPDAQRIGLVDETTSIAALDEHVLARTAAIAAHPPAALTEIKANRTEVIRARYAQHGDARNRAFLTCWFSEQAQSLLLEAAKKF